MNPTLTPHPLQPVALKDVVIDDAFWSPRLQTLREVTLPDVLNKFEQAGAMANFDRVRDHQTGGHAGPPWHDGLVYETICAAADMLRVADRSDAALEACLDGMIERITAAAAADPNGYLNTYTQLEMPACRFGQNGGNQLYQHDIYNAGALIEAAVHYYRATGKMALLKVAARYANHMADVMGPAPKKNIVPEHPLPEEALIKLYLLFREQPALRDRMGFGVDAEQYLRLVEFWLEHRGDYEGRAPLSMAPCGAAYAQDHLPLLQQDSAEGHAVRAALLYTGLASAALVNGRDDYYHAALKLWDNAVHRKMHITGSVGSNQAYEGFGPDYYLPNDAYLETCAAVGMGFFHNTMALAFANGCFADELERTLYNGVLTGVSIKGDAYFYENPLETEGRERWGWHGCPCCPPMLLKILSALGGFIYAHDESSLCVNLFIGSRATLNLQCRTTVRLTQRTTYPWDGKVTLTLDLSGPCAFEVAVRVPGWCAQAQASINGQPVHAMHAMQVRDGYLRLMREWHAGDTIELHLHMPVQLIEAHPSVEATRGKVAVQLGPFIYAVEGLDNGGVTDVTLPAHAHAHLSTESCPNLLGGITVVHGETEQGGQWTAIPFYAIANRGKSPMRVWLRRASDWAENRSVPWDDDRLYRVAP